MPLAGFVALTFLLTIYSLWEFNNVVLSRGKGGLSVGSVIWGLPGAFMPVALYFYGYIAIFPSLLISVIIFAVFSLIIGAKGVLRETFLRSLGLLYVALLMSHLLLLRSVEGGRWWLLFALIVVWAADTCAYYGGRAFGRTKLAPVISPNKTVEGALCGILGSVVAGLIYAQILDFDLTMPVVVILCATASVAGIAGDLVESFIKRKAGVKDSGSLIPGHGGVLDRIDSILFAAPTVYYFLFFLL